jgi:hypothetical protein
MNKLLAFVFVLCSGCSTVVPIEKSWPPAPPALLLPAENLSALPIDKKELSDLLENANINFTQYYLLKIRFVAWQTWYLDQQKIFNDN